MLSIAIVGLPNVGKSTLFNALLGQAQAEASNYPFCTIDPNIGVVGVPDSRLEKISAIVKPQKVVPAAIQFVDIAGLVKGAHTGEGLGNQFLANIRECDAVLIVTRLFEDANITHVSGKIAPKDDIKTIILELIFKDLETVEKRMAGLEKQLKSGDQETAEILGVLKKVKNCLEKEKPVLMCELSKEEKELTKGLQLLTQKPMIFAANMSEGQIKNFNDLPEFKEVAETATTYQAKVMPIAAKLESDLIEFGEEAKDYLTEAGVKMSGLEELILESYDLLGLESFFTAGEKEARAWTIAKGAKAPQAAGVIHTDFEKKFIAAEVIKYNDFLASGGWAGAKEKGLVRTEGKEYVVRDGDVIIFRHGG